MFLSIPASGHNSLHNLRLISGKSDLLAICFFLMLCMLCEISNFQLKQEKYIHWRQRRTWWKHDPKSIFHWCYSVPQGLSMWHAFESKAASSRDRALSCQTLIFGEWFPPGPPPENIVEILCARPLVEAKKCCKAAHTSSSNCSWTSNWGILTDGFIITLC